MKRADDHPVTSRQTFQAKRIAWLGVCLTALFSLPAVALEKQGMPDLCQIEETCLPTSTANLIVWFGLHGYPKLIAKGDSKEDGYIHTVHGIMTDTDARFDWGTRPDKIADGIRKYIEDAGYQCDVEYRGMGKTQFNQDWLKDNDDDNKGFVLLLAYCAYNPNTETYTNAWDAGHAVTLVNATPDMILIHDPAHDDDVPGRKILTPEVITKGVWASREGNVPVSGLLLLSGTELEAPPDAGVMLIGAVCITMHPLQDTVGSSSSGAAGGPTTNIASGSPPSSSSSSATPTPASAPSATKTWAQWIFDLLFSK